MNLLFIITWITVFLLVMVPIFKSITKEQPTQYYQVTKDHLDGIIMPGIGSNLVLHDGTNVIIKSVTYKDSNYFSDGKAYPGPFIRLQNCFVRPETFWKNVKTINNQTVLILPYRDT